MWWPSFISVLQDLYQFALRRPQQQPSSVARIDLGPGVAIPPVSQRSPSSTTVVKEAPVRVLEENVRYDEQHPTTLTIRQTLQQKLMLLTGTADLLPSEWLLYRYYIANKALPWTALLITTIGQWHETLKGKAGVEMSIAPRTGAMMEWQDGVRGYIGEVAAVTPEEQLTVRMLGTPLPGVLTVVQYTKDQWRELRPVFITVR